VTRRIRFNAFAMNTVGHQSPGLWRHPEDRSADYRHLSHWTELAVLLERGLFDGFNLAYAITPGTFADVIEHVVPVLQERGAYPTSYTPGTLRHKLLGQGDRLPSAWGSEALSASSLR